LSANQVPPSYCFGKVEVRPHERLLLVDGRRTAVGSRAFEVLLALIERRDRLVTKDELLNLVWAGLVVEENNLATQISTLRRLFGAAVIATIPNYGYRFAAAVVERVTDPVDAPLWESGPAAAMPSRRKLTNLPAKLPPLYGRDNDLDALRACIGAHRIVTIVGASGMGKTSLAQVAAHGLREHYPDGVWFVELATLMDAATLMGAVAHALGISLHGQCESCDELVAALNAQRLLLILDNGEHLLSAVASLSQALVDGLPETNVLVTSQVPLGVSTEQLFRLEPLAVPLDSDPVRALDYGAVQLFNERVRAIDRHFILGADNSAAVVDICRHLDGLPLAIELAAALVPLLGVLGVHERLGGRLEMLSTGSRVRPSRHQTLRAALDWSHALLSSEEQVVLRRLSVFSSGFTVEAARRVACDDQLDEWTVIGLLERLVERSLVVVDRGDRPRLRLLESVRVYTTERLVESGEMAERQRLHAECFADFFEAAADALYAGTLTEGQFILTRGTEIDNLRESIDEAMYALADSQLALRLLVATAPMSHLLPLRTQALQWWRDLAQRFDPQLSERSTALCRYAWIHWGQSVWWSRTEWPRWPPISKSPLLPLDDARRQGHALCVHALELSRSGDFSEAQGALDEARNLEAPEWPAWLRTRRSLFQARFDREAGEATAAGAELDAALTELETADEGDGRWAFLIRTELALTALGRGEFEMAARSLHALAQLGRMQRQDSVGMGPVLASLVLVLAELDRLDEAAEIAVDAGQQVNRAGLWPKFGAGFALLAAKRGHHESAARMVGAIDAHTARTGTYQAPAMHVLRERVLSEIAITRTMSEVETWLSQGATLDEDAFAELVLDSSRSKVKMSGTNS
jgi:predicted ATPase/DNA-binding winged helix-turn-helix (wHTH) protein